MISRGHGATLLGTPTTCTVSKCSTSTQQSCQEELLEVNPALPPGSLSWSGQGRVWCTVPREGCSEGLRACSEASAGQRNPPTSHEELQSAPSCCSPEQELGAAQGAQQEPAAGTGTKGRLGRADAPWARSAAQPLPSSPATTTAADSGSSPPGPGTPQGHCQGTTGGVAGAEHCCPLPPPGKRILSW